MFGRRVLMTTLDPIPPLLRTAPGCVAMNQRELDLVNAGDLETVAYFINELQAADAADARNIGKHKALKPRRRTLSPSTRLAMAAALNGRAT